MLWKVGVYDDKSDFYFGWYKDLSEIFIQCLPKDLRDMGGRCLGLYKLPLMTLVDLNCPTETLILIFSSQIRALN